MEEYKIVFTGRGKKDLARIYQSPYRAKCLELLTLLETNPYANPPEYKVLKGEMDGLISRRISIQHRLVYQVLEEDKIIKVLMLWTHYHA